MHDGFRPASVSVIDPPVRDELASFHCLLCRAPDLDVRAYVRLGDDGEDVRVLGVCGRCGSAEVMPQSRVGLTFRRTDERPGLAAAGAVGAIAALLAAAALVDSQAAQLALVLLVLVPVAFLTYLARSGPGGGNGPSGP